MSSRFRLSRVTIQKLVELNIPLELVLPQADLPAGFLNQPRPSLTTDQLFSFWRAVGELSPVPGTGFLLGTENRVERYDPAAIAALYSRSFRDALRRMARYKQITCPEVIQLKEGNNGECAIQFIWPLARDTEPRILIDFCFSWVLAIGRRGVGGALNPVRVELTRRPELQALVEEHYRCRVTFGSAHNVVIFKNSDLDRPFVTHNADLLELIAPQLEARLDAQRSTQTIRDQVSAVLKRLLAGQRPTIESVAKELGISSRTLQRRLTQSGVRFQKLLEEARRELARLYLSDSAMDLTEAAYLLGFEDPNSFLRAFQLWEGVTPARYRKSCSLKLCRQPEYV